MRYLKQTPLQILLVMLLLVFLAACRDKIEPEVDDFVEYGWTLYEDRDYVGAYEQFEDGLSMDSVYVDGHNGKGWCHIKLLEPDLAVAAFLNGLDYDPDDSSQVRFEIMAGLSFSYHALGDYERAINRATDLYDLDPIFEFTHDHRIDYQDIIILLAASHMAEGEFSDALTWVRRLDNSFSVDVNTNTGRAELAEKIEELQRL